MTEYVKVVKAKTNKLLRFETQSGKTVAERHGKSLRVTETGKKLGIKAKGLNIIGKTGYPLS